MNISILMLQYLSLSNLSYNPELVIEPFHRGRKLSTPIKYIPEQLDLRDSGLVSPVRQQGKCNACWAFSAAGSIEYHVRQKIKDAEVDVQNILDCTRDTYGCQGGLMEHVFEYKKAFPLKYNFKHKKKKCYPHAKGAHVNDFLAIEQDIEYYLPYMLQKWGPVTVGIDFTKQHGYKGGVIQAEDCGKDPHHAVLVVGYSKNFWIIKNSMGTSWGGGGYAYVDRGKNACGIDSTYAAVATDVSIL